MIDNGKITQENSEEHQIEYDEKPVDDTDFESFKDLVSSDNKIIRTAQTEKKYNFLV